MVRGFLATHPDVHFHFTPAYSSWLNQVEMPFPGRARRDCSLSCVVAPGLKRLPCWSTTSAVLLRNATPSVFHQRHIGRVLRSSSNDRGRRLVSSCGREPRPGRCPPLWPGDVRNDGGGVSAAGGDGSEA